MFVYRTEHDRRAGHERNGYYKAALNGAYGVVPASFVSEIHDTHTSHGMRQSVRHPLLQSLGSQRVDSAGHRVPGARRGDSKYGPGSAKHMRARIDFIPIEHPELSDDVR